MNTVIGTLLYRVLSFSPNSQSLTDTKYFELHTKHLCWGPASW